MCALQRELDWLWLKTIALTSHRKPVQQFAIALIRDACGPALNSTCGNQSVMNHFCIHVLQCKPMVIVMYLQFLHVAIRFYTLLYAGKRLVILLCPAIHCICCNHSYKLIYPVVGCRMLLCAAIHCHMLFYTSSYAAIRFYILLCAAIHCNMLLCTCFSRCRVLCTVIFCQRLPYAAMRCYALLYAVAFLYVAL